MKRQVHAWFNGAQKAEEKKRYSQIVQIAFLVM